MKQYVFSPRPNPKPITGGERFHLEVLSHLEQFGDQVNCISLKDTPYIFRNKFLYNFWLMWKMRNYHRSTFILDFYYHPWCFLSVWAIRYLFKCKIVVSARGIYFIDKGLVVYWLSFLMAFILLKTSDLVIVNSEWTKRELVKRGAKNKKFKIVYPGVELPKERAKKTRKNVSNKTHLLSVGNCIPVKGIEFGVIKKNGNTYLFGEEKLGVGREVAKKCLIENQKMSNKIRDDIWKKVKDSLKKEAE